MQDRPLLVNVDCGEVRRVNAPPYGKLNLSYRSLTISPRPSAKSMIPVNNKPALIGYYLGFAALIPLCGCAFGIAAIILGVLGVLKAGHLNGEGRIHAIVAIVLGAGSVLIYGLIDLLIVAASISDASR